VLFCTGAQFTEYRAIYCKINVKKMQFIYTVNIYHNSIAWMTMLLWSILPFYDFCCFRSVAINSVYKRQFFTFIFAVLLPVLSRHILSFSVWLQQFLKNEHKALALSGEFWTTHKWYLVDFIMVQNLLTSDSVVSKIWKFEFLTRLAWRRLFAPQKLEFWGNLTHKMDININKTHKGISLCKSTSFEPSIAKVRRPVWPVGEFPKSG